MNNDELSIVKEETVVKTNSESFTDQQQMKKLNEKFAKMELVLKITKLEFNNTALQDKLKQQKTNALLAKIEAENWKMKNETEKMQAKMDEKEKQYTDKLEQLQKKALQEKSDAEEENRKLRNEQKEMKEKLNKLEEQLGKKLEKLDEEQKAVQKEHEKKLMEQIVTLQTKVDKLEMEHQKQKVSVDEIKRSQIDQKRKINGLETDQKETKMEKALLNFRQNCWDANDCHNELEITDEKSLTVIHKGKEFEFCTVFATHPIWLDNNSSGFFYFEISIQKYAELTEFVAQNGLKNYIYGLFGFAVKYHHKLDGNDIGTYAYLSIRLFSIDGRMYKEDPAKIDSFKENDIVGCGINSATRQIFFTKNGRRQGAFYLVNYVPEDLFPFVSLLRFGDKIEANFGPNFKFNLATL
ncbi:hypothetical protein niasHT_015099 [Heterodera trifolii]|uniref:B30.2/SPRY domain-containing protein n=1 Tax=Heterodera trifolii TaxID=157864 RepID=A0ABD2L9L4_9BILA